VLLGLLLALLASGCSSRDEAKGQPIRIGGFDFDESTILANIYGGALRAKGYTVEIRPGLGNREVVTPALVRGDIDAYAGYAATELEFLNGGAGEASSDVAQTVAKLRARLRPQNLTALQPSAAVNTNAFAVTKATADRYHLTRLSDLVPLAPNLVFGGPPECPTRPFCLAGLERTYGLKFKEFRALDPGGPLSKAALQQGQVDVALVFSSDGALASGDFVVLEDDKHLQEADNVVPLVRSALATKGVTKIFNDVSAALTTADLGKMNKRAEDEDLQALADGWLAEHGLGRRARG
jgi:osmoprotectant transport system substrate-binding protein